MNIMTGCYFSYTLIIEGMVRASCSSAVRRGVNPSVQMMELTWSVVVYVCGAGSMVLQCKVLRSALLLKHFKVTQVYSPECGVRKPTDICTEQKSFRVHFRLFDFAEN